MAKKCKQKLKQATATGLIKSYDMTIGFVLILITSLQTVVTKLARKAAFWSWVFIIFMMRMKWFTPTSYEFLMFTAAVIGIGSFFGSKKHKDDLDYKVAAKEYSDER